MDGIDWMTVAELVPATAALALFGFVGALPWNATLVALALCGAVVGFAPFNRPVARLFLGDVGSLPIGLLLGWLLTCSPATAISLQRSCCRSTIWLMQQSRCCGGLPRVRSSRKRTEVISTNGPRTMVCPFIRS